MSGLNLQAAKLEKAFLENIKKYDVAAVCNRIGSLMSIFFTKQSVTDYSSAASSDLKRFKEYFAAMLAGEFILRHPSSKPCLSAGVHSDEDICRTELAIGKGFGTMAEIMRWLVIGGTSESVDAVRYLLSKKCGYYRVSRHRDGSRTV